VLSSAHLDRLLVRNKALGSRQNLHIISQSLETCAADFLHADAFHKIRR
jgi:hypothetical protein